MDLPVGLDVDAPLVRVESVGGERPLLAEPLEVVDVLVAAVVPLARLSLGVLFHRGIDSMDLVLKLNVTSGSHYLKVAAKYLSDLLKHFGHVAVETSLDIIYLVFQCKIFLLTV